MKFSDLKFEHKRNGTGLQARVEFPNGYGASVVIGPYSYGGDLGLYELGVTKHGVLCYDTPFTSDVIGHLSPDDVTEYLGKIESLPKAE
jgi:hypothetical protein